MIQRQYSQGINATMPTNYFERWYADMWYRNFDRIAPPNKLQEVLTNELAQLSATVEYVEHYKYKVTFNNDADYTVFVLRWS
jgi:histidinol dehydrogenase